MVSVNCIALKHKISEKYGVVLVKKIEEQLKLEYAVSFDTATDEFVDVIYAILENHISDDPRFVLDNSDTGKSSKKHKIVLEARTELKEKILECMGDRNCLEILDCVSGQYKTTYQIISHSGVNRSNAYRKIELLESVGLIEKRNIHQSKMYSYVGTFESITIKHQRGSNQIIMIAKNEKYKKRFMSMQKSMM
ncbi:MAG: hypothetical protein OEY10_06750 [Nitrosopumilus sp.]|nr:hypothetical protein [Nitrosopumilus sp.]